MPSASTAPAPSSAPAVSPVVPVAAGGGASSPGSRMCRWPGHGDVKHFANGFCSRDISRVKALGLNPATIPDEDVAGLPGLWEGRRANVRGKATERLLAARPSKESTKESSAIRVAELEARVRSLEQEIAAARDALVLGIDQMPPELFTEGSLGHAIACEMHDYAMVVRHASLVFSHVTNGRVSKPNTLPEAVIAEADDARTRDIDDAVAEELVPIREALGDEDMVPESVRATVARAVAAITKRHATHEDLAAAHAALTAAGVTPTGTLEERIATLVGDAAADAREAQDLRAALTALRAYLDAVNDNPARESYPEWNAVTDEDRARLQAWGDRVAQSGMDAEGEAREELRDDLARALGYQDGAGVTADADLVDEVTRRLDVAAVLDEDDILRRADAVKRKRALLAEVAQLDAVIRGEAA